MEKYPLNEGPESSKGSIRDRIKPTTNGLKLLVALGQLVAAQPALAQGSKIQEAKSVGFTEVMPSGVKKYDFSTELISRASAAWKKKYSSKLQGMNFDIRTFTEMLVESQRETNLFWRAEHNNGELDISGDSPRPVETLPLFLPDGISTTTRFTTGDSEYQLEKGGNSFKVTYEHKICEVTARHNLPAEASGWHYDSEGDVAARCIGFAKGKEKYLAVSSAGLGTNEVVGKFGVTLGASNEKDGERYDTPFTGRLFSIRALLQAAILTDKEITSLKSYAPNLPWETYLDHGLCKLMPTAKADKPSEQVEIDKLMYRSGAPEVILLKVKSKDGEFLMPRLVGVQSFKVGRILCYASPESTQRVLQKAAEAFEKKRAPRRTAAHK